MQERIFTMTAKAEVPARFLGSTVPFTVPSTKAEVEAVAGDEKTLVAIFNQAHALNVQKSIKAAANKEGATLDGLRDHAKNFKYGEVRVRGGNTGAGAKTVKPQTVERVLGADLLATFTPEQRALYEKQMAALRPQVAEATAGATTENQPTPAAPAPAAGSSGPTGNKKRR